MCEPPATSGEGSAGRRRCRRGGGRLDRADDRPHRKGEPPRREEQGGGRCRGDVVCDRVESAGSLLCGSDPSKYFVW
jgi:hypothetical protein